jgi:hypothetical protein
MDPVMHDKDLRSSALVYIRNCPLEGNFGTNNPTVFWMGRREADPHVCLSSCSGMGHCSLAGGPGQGMAGPGGQGVSHIWGLEARLTPAPALCFRGFL